MKRIIAFLLILAILVPFAFAAEFSEKPQITVVWNGATPIRDSIISKSPEITEDAVLKTATDTTMRKISYPYDVPEKSQFTTVFKILKFRCDEKLGACGYWVEAYRGGKSVQTNSPIWLMSSPVHILESETFNDKTNTITITMREDPKAAVEEVLQNIVEVYPLGKPIIGTKE